MPSDTDTKKPRVLVVDDDSAMGETLADGLADRGYDALAVASSADAVARLAISPLMRWLPTSVCPARTGSFCWPTAAGWSLVSPFW